MSGKTMSVKNQNMVTDCEKLKYICIPLYKLNKKSIQSGKWIKVESWFLYLILNSIKEESAVYLNSDSQK